MLTTAEVMRKAHEFFTVETAAVSVMTEHHGEITRTEAAEWVAREQAEREARERKLYGMTAAELNDARAYYMGAGYASSTLGLVQSWLSDVQELVERGHKDAARVIINRCKFLLDIERDEMARAAR